MKFLGAITAIILLAAIGGLLSAFTGITLYRWFLLPLGAPSLSATQLFGAMFFVSYLTYTHPESKDDDREPGEVFLSALGKMLVKAGLFLGIGWAAHAIIY